MKNLLNNIQEILLMVPGDLLRVPDAVYEALSQKTSDILIRILQIMDAIKAQLQTVLHTRNVLIVPISGTGSAGMETCFVNLVEPGDPVLILSNGVFGRPNAGCRLTPGGESRRA